MLSGLLSFLLVLTSCQGPPRPWVCSKAAGVPVAIAVSIAHPRAPLSCDKWGLGNPLVVLVLSLFSSLEKGSSPLGCESGPLSAAPPCL